MAPRSAAKSYNYPKLLQFYTAHSIGGEVLPTLTQLAVFLACPGDTDHLNVPWTPWRAIPMKTGLSTTNEPLPSSAYNNLRNSLLYLLKFPAAFTETEYSCVRYSTDDESGSKYCLWDTGAVTALHNPDFYSIGRKPRFDTWKEACADNPSTNDENIDGIAWALSGAFAPVTPQAKLVTEQRHSNITALVEEFLSEMVAFDDQGDQDALQHNSDGFAARSHSSDRSEPEAEPALAVHSSHAPYSPDTLPFRARAAPFVSPWWEKTSTGAKRVTPKEVPSVRADFKGSIKQARPQGIQTLVSPETQHNDQSSRDPGSEPSHQAPPATSRFSANEQQTYRGTGVETGEEPAQHFSESLSGFQTNAAFAIYLDQFNTPRGKQTLEEIGVKMGEHHSWYSSPPRSGFQVDHDAFAPSPTQSRTPREQSTRKNTIRPRSLSQTSELSAKPTTSHEKGNIIDNSLPFTSQEVMKDPDMHASVRLSEHRVQRRRALLTGHETYVNRYNVAMATQQHRWALTWLRAAVVWLEKHLDESEN